MFIIEVFVTNSSLNVNQLYSYYYEENIASFKRVEVIFKFSKTSAIVIDSFEVDDLNKYEEEVGFKLSKINKVIDEEPIISLEQYELAKWLSKTTVSSFINCLNTMLPKVLRTSKEITKAKQNEYIKLIDLDKSILTKRQIEVLNELKDDMLVKEGRIIGKSIFNKLLEKGFIEIVKKEVDYHEDKLIINDNFKELTPDQKNVYDDFLNNDKLVSLLFGVTGSGKTEVYLHLTRHYLNEGKEVLILVPEISLTPQMISRVKERFNEVIFYHSLLNDQERYEQYKRVKKGEVKVVVGTRSSVFLPFNNLGLIIIDEEHDTSYKQDNSPCYLAKNVAIKRALDFKAKVLLASATPSLDSYTRALKNEYALLKLKNRINDSPPNIEIINLLEAAKNKESLIITKTLKIELDETLNNNKQAIILLNRRGYSPIIKCGDCGTTLMCNDCDTPLNYHHSNNLLICHQCSRTYKMVKTCPKCHHDNLIEYGFGTEKVEEVLKQYYPKANIDRMDRDNVSKKGAHKSILDRFEKREIDILIGTQMIAKGLDYPDVTLVGILNADAGLAHQDYNAAKLTFDLLMQAAGRSGRSIDKGKVLIQAFNPDHYVLKAILNQDYDYFYNIEMNYRLKTSYPPYSHLVEIMISDRNKEHIDNSLNYLNQKIDKLTYKHYRPMELRRIKGNHRYRILLTNKDLQPLIKDVWNIIDDYLKERQFAKIKVDIDPLYLE